MRLPNPTPAQSPEQIFEQRWGRELHYIDWQRFAKLAKYYKGGRFLDAGCFNSPLIIELKRIYPTEEFIGVDKSRYVLDILQERHPEVRYVVGDINNLQFKDEHFSYVVAAEILEHLEAPEKAVKELYRVLEKGGTLAVSVPDNEIENGRVSPDHIWSFNENELRELLEKAGFRQIEITKYEDTTKHLIAYGQKN